MYSADGASYGEAVPTGTDVGDYDVWYKVASDANHNDTEPAKLVVAIREADAGKTAPNLVALTYTGAAQALVKPAGRGRHDALRARRGR